MGDLSTNPHGMLKELLTAAHELRSRALARLSHLVSVESPSGDPEGVTAINSLLRSGFEAVGAAVKDVPGTHGDHLVCRWKGQSPAEHGHVLVIGHSDTVFPIGTTVARPFALAEDQDTVTGPGVYDMKGALVAFELAMSLVQAQRASLLHPVHLVIVNDEETGSADGQRVVAQESRNAIRVLGLEPPLPGGGLKIGRRGVARWQLQVQGVEAHAGLDSDRGVSAVEELVDQLLLIRSGLPASPGVSVNVGVISGGTGANVVAGHAHAVVGVRFSTARDEAQLRALFTSLKPVRLGASLNFTQLSYRPPWAPDSANPVALELGDLARRMGCTLETGVSGGAGDTNLTGSAGIPTVDGLGPEGGGAHAANEHASVGSLLQRAALLAAYLQSPPAG